MAPAQGAAYAEVMGRLLALILWLGTTAAVVGEESNVFRTYDIGAADPSALQDVARRVVGAGGQVTYDPRQQRLLVLATESQHEQLAGMMRQAVPAAANIRIDVTFRGSERNTEAGIAVEGSGGMTREEGIAHTVIRIRPRIQGGVATRDQRVVQTLVVANGRMGSLRVGESVPQLAWLMDYGCRQGWIRETVSWQDVGSFLVVEPLILDGGPMIRLRITPELRGQVEGRPYQTRFARAATEVVVADGQSYPLGGLASAQEFFARFLLGVNRQGAEEALDISVTPHIIRP